MDYRRYFLYGYLPFCSERAKLFSELLYLLFFLFLAKSYLSFRVFLGGSDSKESALSAGDPGLIPGSGRSPGEGNGSPLQDSCLEHPMDRPCSCKVSDTTEQPTLSFSFMRLVALLHVGSSWTRDWTAVPCTARWILNHWTTREARLLFFMEDAGETHAKSIEGLPWWSRG